jgi:AraC family ethanolamine operon transcriptional activator
MTVRHNQMSQGGYAASLSIVTLSPGLTFSFTAYAAAMTSQGAPPAGKYGFAIPLATSDGVFVNHKSVGPDEVGVVRPNQEFYLFRPPQFECAMFFPDAAMVERSCIAMFGRSLAEIGRGGPTLRASRGAAPVFARHIAQISGAAVVDAKPLAGWTASRGGAAVLANELVDDFLAIICPAEPLRGWSARQRVVNRAWEIVEDDDQGVVSVTDLCVRLGVPIRTLDDAFRACLGVGPKRFILGIRLNKVRRLLGRPDSEATTVTSVATRFAFFHFGHFAQQYRRLFGESPSQTLGRALGDTARDM